MTTLTQNTQSLDERIWGRQYAQTPGEAFHAGATRVGQGVARTPEDAEAYARMIIDKRFIPGGRILAGAGSTHGNILNCFVQDGNPHDDGTTKGALHLAKKLALVTKVGGGNGLNLDNIPAKRPYTGKTGQAYVTINHTHQDHEGVQAGRYVDLQVGKQVTRGYRELQYVDAELATTISNHEDTLVLRVDDSVVGIWTAATEMVNALLAGREVILDLTALRPEGSTVKGSGGTSSGPASFAVEIYDNFAKWARLGGAEHAGPVATLRYVHAPTLRAIRHAGVRRGAGMATLSATHEDLLDFITAKDLEREQAEGDIGTFNISVLASDAFMRDATTRPDSRAAKTLDTIAQHAWQTGEPGIIFNDAINLHNPLAQVDGPIMATNPCVTGDTKILTTEGPRAFRELAEAGRDITVWAVNPKTRDMTVRVMRNPRRTREATPIVKITFDSGLELRCTPDHNLFTLAGEKVPAAALKPGDSVLAYGGAPTNQYVPIPTGAQTHAAPAINHKVISIQNAGVEDVYNGTVDDLHTYLIPDQLEDGTYLGGIVSANCGEIPLYPAEPCDLGAINLSAFVREDDDGRPYYDALGLQETSRLAVRFLDEVLDAERAPLQEIRDAIDDKRRIGLGLMGLADMLIKLGLRYDSDEGRAMVQQVVSDIRNTALEESQRLGGERGVPEGVKRAGLNRRNIAVFTVAPTGTTSMLAGVSGGVEPMYAATFVRKIGTDYVTVVQPLLDEILATIDTSTFANLGGSRRFIRTGENGIEWDREALVAALNEHKGSLLPLLADLPDDARLAAFVTAHDIPARDHVLMQAAIQRAYDWVNDDAWRQGDKSGMTLAGNSLSKTINLPNQAQVTDVHEAYELAWESGCKGITVYRDGSRDMQVLTTGNSDKGEAKADEPKPTPTPTPVANPPEARGHYERPKRMRGITDQVRLADKLGNNHGFFITVNTNGHNDPREVFIISGKGGDETNGDSEALGRVVSIALQWGVPPEALIKTLRGINGGMFGTYQGRIVTSKADLIAVALETATADETTTNHDAPVAATAPAAPSKQGGTCPKCGGPTIRTEGCETCGDPSCLWSRCG